MYVPLLEAWGWDIAGGRKVYVFLARFCSQLTATKIDPEPIFSKNSECPFLLDSNNCSSPYSNASIGFLFVPNGTIGSLDGGSFLGPWFSVADC